MAGTWRTLDPSGCSLGCCTEVGIAVKFNTGELGKVRTSFFKLGAYEGFS